MCFLSSPADGDTPPLNALATAYEALREAERQHYDLTALLNEGAVPRDLGSESLDARITRIVGEVTRRRYEYDRAVCSLMLGEPFRNDPSSQAVRLEMQTRARRQAGGTRFDLLRTAMAAVDATPADAPMPVPARRTSFAALDAGVHSPAAAE